MRTSEWIAVAFFAWLAAASLFRPLPPRRRSRLIFAALAMCAAIAVIAQTLPPMLRSWAPAVYVLVGYFLSGLLFVAPSERFERWLVSWDRCLLGEPAARFSRWPTWTLALLDVAYVFCFLVVPAGFAVLIVAGRSDLADQYWTMVLGAEFGSFAPLAIVQSRPPWAIESPSVVRDRRIHRFASSFVRRATIGANTFPSGHAAASLAVPAAVIDVAPGAGGALFVLGITISIACIAGRYHYVMDVLAGAALAGVLWTIVVL